MTLPNKERGCHRTGFEKDCRELVASGKCERWVHVTGINPQTNAPIDVFNCVDDIGYMTNISLVQAQRQMTATVDKLCNEVHRGNEGALVGTLAQLNVMRQLNGDQSVIPAGPSQKLIEN